MKGDVIYSLNGKEILNQVGLSEMMQENENELVSLKIARDGEFRNLNVSPNEENQIGIIYGSNLDVKTRTYGFAESISAGFDYGYWTLKDYVTQFKYVFTEKGATQVGGFGAIGSLFPSGWDWQGFWMATALISIILAFMNILPIPALDGGRLVFLGYETITNRKPNPKVENTLHYVMYLLLMGLFIFITYNDILRLFNIR